MPPPSVPVAESDETRIARLEAARDEHTERLRVLFPLVSQYAVLEERFLGLRNDLNKGFDAIRDELKEQRADQTEDNKSLRAAQAEENKALRAELKELKDDQVSRAKERRGYLAMVAVCAIGLFGNFIAQIVAPDPAPQAPAQERTK